MPKATKTQPELQFVDLTNVDTRNQVREVSKSREERLHWISVDIIRIRPGLARKTFNWRLQKEGESDVDYEKRIQIPELADAIHKSNGPDDCLVGDFKDGLFYINGGERRFRAIRYMREVLALAEYPDGRSTELVEVLQNPKWFTDKDRRRRISTSQSQLKYSPLELAMGYEEMKQEEGLTNEEIAKELGISRQTVDNYINLLTLDPVTQQEVDKGNIPLSTALAHNRKAKHDEKQAQKHTNNDLTPPEDAAKWRKDKTDKDLEDDELLSKQDNTVSSPSTKKMPEGSGEAIFIEPEESIWKRAIKMMAGLQEQNKSPEYIIGELKLQFLIQNRK